MEASRYINPTQSAFRGIVTAMRFDCESWAIFTANESPYSISSSTHLIDDVVKATGIGVEGFICSNELRNQRP
jgi:hypothetical protein